MTTPLQPQLDRITEQTRRLVPEERFAPAERSIAELLDGGYESHLPAVGSGMPPFSLPDAQGRSVSSTDLLALGPLIVSFFRGRWDPYCVTELEAWRDLYPRVRERGGLVVAISPQTLRQNDFLVQQHGLQFPVLRDEDCGYASELGLAYSIPEYLEAYYSSILVNIPFLHSGKNSLGTPFSDKWKLPVPATLLVDRAGIVRLAQGFADFRVRPEPEQFLQALAGL